MSSTDRPSVGVTLVERSFVCPSGGGFESERWSVQVNDGWMPLPVLVRRGRVGSVRVAVLDQDDPDGVGGSKWGDRAPQVWFKRSTRVLAPIGTGLWRRTWRPLIDLQRILEYPLPQRIFDEHFEIRGEDRFVSVGVLARRRAEREASARLLTRLAGEETHAYASALVAALGGAPDPATDATAGAEGSASDASAHAEPDAAAPVRHPPVRTLSLPSEPAPVPATRPATRR